MQTKLILASSSPFRQQLLDRLQLKFDCLAPEVDESILADEDAIQYVRRLAEAKARVIALQHPDAIVIGSDQCALRDGQILGKPGNHDNALVQLRKAQGKRVVFHTAVCVLQHSSGFRAVEEVPFEVEFRQLSDAQLEHYLRVEEPYQCAGSFKAEGYGSCLFKRMRGDDPSALIGLPLFKLVEMLEAAGMEIV
ncbi:MAG: Maf family nucleotide pyrophosphatase [Gammaproteobacteria bacterium]|nr:Maf family nucleotide pyrophosphatase [Gammaproteobacteria bacterium]